MHRLMKRNTNLVLLRELMNELNGSGRLCAAELTALGVMPILEQNNKALREVRTSNPQHGSANGATRT